MTSTGPDAGSILWPAAGRILRPVVTALLIGGIAFAGWQLWPSTDHRIGLDPHLVSHDEASAFIGKEVDRSSALHDFYSYADYVSSDGVAHLMIELVYEDRPLPERVPAPSDGGRVTFLVEGDGDAVPVSGSSSTEAVLDFTTGCVRVRVSGTGFTVGRDKIAGFRELLMRRASTAAQGDAPTC